MTPAELFTDLLGRVAETVDAVLDGPSDELAHRPTADAKAIA